MNISVAQKAILQDLNNGKELQCDNASCKIYWAGSTKALNLNTIAKLLQLGFIQIDQENSDNLFLYYTLTEQGKKAIQPSGADLVAQRIYTMPTPRRQQEEW